MSEKRVFTQEEREVLKAKMLELIEQTGGKAAPVCKLIGIKGSIWCQLKDDKYTGDVDRQYTVMEDYFKAQQAASKVYRMDEYVPTSISEDIYEIIRNCHAKGGLAIAAGDAGVGKTRAAKKYADDNPNMTLYFTLNPCITCIKPVLKLIASRLSITEKTIDEMWIAISGKLRNNMVLIFDEAQHLPIKTIETLRAFADDFADRGQTLGIVFIGNVETVSNFSGNKRAEFAQIANRTKQKRMYTVKHIRRTDIEALFPALSGKDMEIEFLHEIARSRQALRGAVNLFANAYDNENITYDGLVAMAKHMEMNI